MIGCGVSIPQVAVRGANRGGAVDPLTPPDPPTITLTSGATDLTPEFTFVAAINLEEDDVIRFYDQTLGLLSSHTVTAGEAGGDPIFLDLPELEPGDYDFYATHARGTESDPSNVESITLEAPVTAEAVNFDGTNDYLRKTSALDGSPTDGKSFVAVVWIKSGADGADAFIIHGASSQFGNQNFRIYKSSSDGIVAAVNNASATPILSRSTTADTVETADGWRCVMIAVDLTDTNKSLFYIGDTQSGGTTGTYTDDNMDFTLGWWTIGASNSASAKLNGDLYQVSLWFNQWIDLSQQSNRRLFFGADGKPVDPAAAITALGTPNIHLLGEETDWHTNLGSGGGFTENGALTVATTSPND